MEVQYVDKVDGHVQLLEAFTSLNVLDSRDIVEGKIEVLKFFQFIKVLHLFDDVVLQVDDLEMAAEYVQVLNFD